MCNTGAGSETIFFFKTTYIQLFLFILIQTFSFLLVCCARSFIILNEYEIVEAERTMTFVALFHRRVDISCL